MPAGLGHGPDPLGHLRARAEALGLIVWQCDAVGVVVDPPRVPGAAGRVLSGGALVSALARAAREWETVDRPPPTEIMPGLSAIAMSDTTRGRRLGYVVVATLEPRAIESAEFESACRSAGVDPQAAAGELRALATSSPAEAQRLASLLHAMHDDLRQRLGHESAIAGFTSELTLTYEQVSLLYELGRSMRGFPEPREFLARTAESLQHASEFGWTAARLRAPKGAASEPPTVAGRPKAPLDAIASTLDALERELAPERTASILTRIGGAALPAGSQLLAQPILVEGRVAGLIIAGERGGADPQISSYDTHLFETAAAFVSTFFENHELNARERATFVGLVRALTASIDAKDPYTRGHSQRVAHLGRELAIALGRTPEECERVHLAGLLHDVGKIGVPEAVLLKAGRLTDDEFAIIKRHPAIGHDILGGIPRFDDVLGGVLHHHERWDGEGYPQGLAGEEIPWIARVLGLADTFDAMSSTRSYRGAMPREKVLAEVLRCSGSQFDPALVPAFLGLDLAEYDRMIDADAPRALAA